MKKLRIALDCDGFLANFVAGALGIVEEVTGKKFAPMDVTSRDFTTALGLSPREASEVKRAIGARRGFAMALPPYPEARQGVRRLRELGDVLCVTVPWKSNIWWRAEREAWLALHFGIDLVHFADGDGDDKTRYEADLFVDDDAEQVRKWLAAWPGRTAVFWRTLHNRGEAVPLGAHTTQSWEVLNQIARETAHKAVLQVDPTLDEVSP